MKVILGGYLETALVRSVDEALRPERNRTTHGYYMCLNRKTPKAFFDRAATFIALADEVIVPSIDWALSSHGHDTPDLSAERLGVSINGPENYGGSEWDDETKAFVDIVLDNRALSLESWVHVSRFETSVLEPDDQRELEARRDEIRRSIAHHYLCRLLLQIRASTAADAFLVLGEPDLLVLKDLGEFLLLHRMPTPYPIPDLTGRVLDAENFAAGLLNFSPPDALALSAVKRDDLVREYAGQVTRFLRDTQSIDSQRQILRAMKRAHQQAGVGKTVEAVFEVATWVAKPIHYIPVVGNVLSIAEDVKDIVGKWVERKVEDKEWYLLGAKMTDIAISDYLARNDNLLR